MQTILRSRADSMLSACALVVVLTWIITSDTQLHAQMTRRVQGVSFDPVGAVAYLQGVAINMAEAAQASSFEFAHMWTFGVVAVVLTIWMYRS